MNITYKTSMSVPKLKEEAPITKYVNKLNMKEYQQFPKYTIVGVILGLLLIVLSLVIQVNLDPAAFDFGLESLVAISRGNPLLYVIGLAPLVLGFFGWSLDRLSRSNYILSINQLSLLQDVREYESPLIKALDIINEGLVIYDKSNRLIFFNQKFLEYYPHLSPAIKLGSTFEEITRYGLQHKQYADAIGQEEEWLTKRLSAQQQRESNIDQELSDSRSIQISERTTETGERVGLHTDITQHKALQEKLLRDKKTAEVESSNKAFVLSDMSHELRTPLNSIIGFGEMLADKEAILSDSQRQDFAHNINVAGKHLLCLINDVLDVSKLDKGARALSPVLFELPEIIENCRAVYYQKCLKKGIELILSHDVRPDEHIRFDGDTTALNQILFNIIDNAIKFTEEGSVSLTISHQQHQSAQGLYEITFSIADTGKGIPSHALGLIFEQFSEENNTITNNYGSTGLGLTIAKKLAMLMGGNIKADSVIGKGTEVVTTVVLPLAQSESNAEGAIHDSHGISPKVILAVDDVPLNLTIVSLLLEKDGHEVHIACNGAEALEKVINNTPYDAILMDYHMPVMDGVEATKAIRKLDDLTKKVTPIFAFTADVEVENQQKLLNAGVDSILKKPLDQSKLRKKLATIG